MDDPLQFPQVDRDRIDKYLPSPQATQELKRPFVTLTYASSLDSQIALAAGTATVLSNAKSKCMTHFLRSCHDAILVGSGTAISDDPTLNSRLDDAIAFGLERQPRPVILDRRGRCILTSSSKVVAAARDRRGKGPWVLRSASTDPNATTDKGELKSAQSLLTEVNGELISISKQDAGFADILNLLYDRNIRSVMVEGGAQLINDILSNNADLIDALIVTIAPTYLGKGGATISPSRRSTERAALRCSDISWLPLGSDVVMCSRMDAHANA